MCWQLHFSDKDTGICPFHQAHIHIPDLSTSADPALEPNSLSQGKSCLAPCYFWLCLCLWDPLTFSNENKTTEGAALAFGLLRAVGWAKAEGLNLKLAVWDWNEPGSLDLSFQGQEPVGREEVIIWFQINAHFLLTNWKSSTDNRRP